MTCYKAAFILVDITVSGRVLSADVIVGDLAEALVLVQARSRDEVLHVAVVSAGVQVGIGGLRGGEALGSQNIFPVSRLFIY